MGLQTAEAATAFAESLLEVAAFDNVVLTALVSPSDETRSDRLRIGDVHIER